MSTDTSTSLPSLSGTSHHTAGGNWVEIRTYCLDRIEELRSILNGGTAWGFLGAAAFVDFLSRLRFGKATGQTQYKAFICEFFPDHYRGKRFARTHISDEYDTLPSQFYHILRCGVLHSFSLSVDEKSEGKGWTSSVIISTNGKHGDREYRHLDSFTEGDYDAIVLIGDELANDLVKTVDRMFDAEDVRKNSVKWWTKCKPLGELKLPS